MIRHPIAVISMGFSPARSATDIQSPCKCLALSYAIVFIVFFLDFSRSKATYSGDR